MTHDILTEEGVTNSRHPHARKGREGKGREQGREGKSWGEAPSIVTAVDASSHVHKFVPTPAGRLFGKVLWRNRCDCGQPEHPEPASMDGTSGPVRLPRGPSCRRCGFPTVDGLVDAANPLHPCCAEPALMALGSRRKDR